MDFKSISLTTRTYCLSTYIYLFIFLIRLDAIITLHTLLLQKPILQPFTPIHNISYNPYTNQ